MQSHDSFFKIKQGNVENQINRDKQRNWEAKRQIETQKQKKQNNGEPEIQNNLISTRNMSRKKQPFTMKYKASGSTAKSLSCCFVGLSLKQLKHTQGFTMQ